MKRVIRNIQKIFNPSEEELDAFRKSLKVVHLNKNDFFLREGEVCQSMAFLEQGSMRLFYDAEDREVCNDFYFENSIVGSFASFLSETPSIVNIAAIEDCELLVFSRESTMDLIHQYPSLKRLANVVIEEHLIRTERREAELLKYPPEDRYRLLLEIHPKIFSRIPLYFVASYLNITPETLSRYRKKSMDQLS
jgi:CRP/FNR family transcriptional regulator, anaerobic regulatory protein